MDLHVASSEKNSKQELLTEIEIVSHNPVMSGLLHSMTGLLTILDKDRKVIALNDSFLKLIGVKNPSESLGLRLGETLQCIHAHEEPGGCGTTSFCSSCGAAIAIVSSLNQNKPAERICALTAIRGTQSIDIALLVRSHPIQINGIKFVLLFLQDITLQQQRAALERTFFHDVNNMLCSLVGACELLKIENSKSDLVRIINQSSLRLKKAVEIQRSLSQNISDTYQTVFDMIDTSEVIEELKSFFQNHPVARNKNLHFLNYNAIISIKTDMNLLLRILCNMVTNALEAGEENCEVRIWIEESDNLLSFCVWNHEPIPQGTACRIFQRNFSTKAEAGRGLGTYSMKLFGEEILGGKVDFTTSQEEGTIFKFSLSL